MKERIILSLGGSLIFSGQDYSINYNLLEQLKQGISKKYKTHKFVIVAGGGPIARKYIQGLEKQRKNKRELSLAGIRATRMNALFLMQFFGKKQANDFLPMSMKEVKDNLSKNDVVICGSLRFEDDSTSDGTAANLANYLNGTFINLTNVPGLYTKDPNKYKDAKLIPKISWRDFKDITKKIKFHAGQHFVLDQKAAERIHKNKTKTYILGSELKNLNNLLNKKSFRGTVINEEH